MNDRSVRILDLLTNNKNFKITMLAELLNVSPVTMRRDLDNLERKGIIKRSHGYASLDGADDTSKRMAYCYLIKRRIAKAAAQIVEENETIMVESGSCCAFFAEELALMHKNVTIITNSIYLANYLRKTDIKIILLGGCYQHESQVLLGPIVAKLAQNFYTDKFFLGTNGFIPEQGFTSGDYSNAETVSSLSKCSKNVFILTESAKFQRRGTYCMIQFDKISGVFTDDKITKEAETVLIKNNVKLYKVPAAEERIRWYKFPGLPPILYKEKENEF